MLYYCGRKILEVRTLKKAKMEKYIRSADLGDNAASNFVNYDVKKKAEGKYGFARVLMLIGYIVFVLVFAGGLAAAKLYPIIALTPMLTWILILCTWRFVSIEYEYYILDGEFKLMKVYGSKNMRVLCRTRVSGMELIAPYCDEYKAEVDKISASHRIEGVSSMSAPDIYCAVFEDGGEKYAVLFEVTEKTLKVLRYYNQNTVISKPTR